MNIPHKPHLTTNELHIDGLVQDCSISSACSMEILQMLVIDNKTPNVDSIEKSANFTYKH